MLKQVSALALVAGLLVNATVAANAQRSGARGIDADWEELGCVQATRRPERQVIRLGRSDGRFTAIRFASKRNDVLVDNVRVEFGNGDRQDINIRERIREDAGTRAVDLDGRNRFLARVVMVVERDERSPRRGPAELCAYGLPAVERAQPPRQVLRREPPREVPRSYAPPARALQWVELGCAGTGLRDDYDVIPVGRQDGRFRAIRLRAVGGKVDVAQVRVVYGNGSPELLDYSQSIDRGAAGALLDLKGGDRFIRQVDLIAKRDTKDAVRGIIRGVISGRGVRGAEVCVDGLEDGRFGRRR